jgi:uncharacterized protein
MVTVRLGRLGQAAIGAAISALSLAGLAAFGLVAAGMAAPPAFAQAPLPGVVPPSELGTGAQEPEAAPPRAGPATPRAAQPRPRAAVRRAPPQPSAYDRMVEQANSYTVTMVSGTINGSYLTFASDLALALDQPDKLRILPVLSRGSYGNIFDVALLRGIDLGLVRTTSIDIAVSEGRIPDLKDRLAYIALLSNDEVHIVAPKSITSIEQLRGKRVNMDVTGSDSNVAGRRIFETLGIAATFSNHDSGTAYGMVARGELDAALFISSKPIRAIQSIPQSANLHLLPVPWSEKLRDQFYPATFSGADYANLAMKPGETETIAAKTLLVTYNWQQGSERYQRVQRFVDAFFANFDELKKPNRHPKWQEVNLAATFSGLPRFKPAAEWLARQQASAQAAPPAEAQRRQFEQFLSQQPQGRNAANAAERERLFEEFTRWQRSRVQ